MDRAMEDTGKGGQIKGPGSLKVTTERFNSLNPPAPTWFLNCREGTSVLSVKVHSAEYVTPMGRHAKGNCLKVSFGLRMDVTAKAQAISTNDPALAFARWAMKGGRSGHEGEKRSGLS